MAQKQNMEGMLNYEFNPLSDWQSVNIAIEELESNLTLATEDLSRLQQELMTGEETHEFISQAASQALVDLDRAKSELERTLKGAKDPCSASCSRGLSLGSTTSGDLEKALRIRGCLESSMKCLRIELEGMRKEVGNLREREANARAAVLMLTQELFKAKDDVLKAIQDETKAEEDAIPGLSMTSENTKTEAEFGKEELNAILREPDGHLHDFHYSLINASLLQSPYGKIEMRGHPILYDQSVMIYKRKEKKKKKKRKHLLHSSLVTLFGEKESSNQ